MNDDRKLSAERLEAWRQRLYHLQDKIRGAVRTSMLRQSSDSLSRRVRDDAGDTIFAIDLVAEEILLPICEKWGREEPFVLVAEGIEPSTGRLFGRAGSEPATRLILDPIDGTRALMYDKRSAWSLAGLAPNLGEQTNLSTIELAVMTELPTSKQTLCDRLTAILGEGTQGLRCDLHTGQETSIRVIPSTHTDLRHGFATVCNFFQGGKELCSRLEEELIGRVNGGWRTDKAEVYCDQYICSGGQLAELALGKDRMVIDLRPLIHRALGYDSTLCSRPYDLCTALIATEAGCIVTAADGRPLDAPLDTTTNMDFAAYANVELAAKIQPILGELLARHGLSF